ncbi:hypothetical protein RIF29_28532 [Crotalaria pallida]|uniref:Uncharacterized protein n=1 Tax=Crotalaria pallida TaxID=3830 RepID=A0AAN9HVF6_CROPI
MHAEGWFIFPTTAGLKFNEKKKSLCSTSTAVSAFLPFIFISCYFRRQMSLLACLETETETLGDAWVISDP